MCVFVIPVSAVGHWPNLLNGGHGGYVLSTSGVLLGRVDGSVWYHLPIGCTLEGILSSNQPTNSKRPSMPLIPIYRVVFLPEHNL